MNDEYTPGNARDGPEEHPSYLPGIIKTPNGSPIEKLYNVLISDEQLPSAEIYRDTATYHWETDKNSISIRIYHHEVFEKKRKSFFRLLIFFLQKTVAKNFPDYVYIPFREMVDIGMYSRGSSAKRAVEEFALLQDLVNIERTYKKRNHGNVDVTRVLFGAFFTNIETDSKGALCKPNNDLISLAICTEYTLLPQFSYSLSDNAYVFVWYMFFLSRQNLDKITKKGFFHISLDSIRRRLGLRSIAEIKNREYKKLIVDPIMATICEAQNGFMNDPKSQSLHVSIEIHTCRPNNIQEWLQGYVTVYMDPSTSEGYQRYVRNAENCQRQIEIAKEKAREQALTKSDSAH